MRRMLLPVLLILLLLPCAALCEPAGMPYDAALCLSYRTLTDTQRHLFDLLYDAVWQGETTVRLPDMTAYADACDVMELLLRDCPELCALDNAYSLVYPLDHPERAEEVCLRYAMHPGRQAELVKYARQLAKQAAGSDWERALYLHDALCLLLAYTPDAASPYTAYGALMEHRAVCEGYAKAMALLCRLNGIPCSVVSGWAEGSSGENESHAWNVLELREGVVVCDVTWDDQQPLSRCYFALSDAQMGVNHTRDAVSAALPRAEGSGLDWYAVNGWVIGQDEEATDALLLRGVGALVRDGMPFAVRFVSREAYQAAADDPARLLERYNALCAAGERFSGAYRFVRVDAQRCLTILR
ncbi:MAG: transglutaminase domain-containing protein [bacterium]|nr:transglutaminase domain-containing protein [bacterium]